MKDYEKEIINDKFHKTDDNSYLIYDFNSYDILQPNVFLYITFFLSSFLFYQKVKDNFLSHWQAIFYPIYIYFIVNIIKTFFNLMSFSKETNNEHKDIDITKLKIENLPNIILISYFFRFILYIMILCIIYNTHNFLDKRKDDFLIKALQFLIFSFLWCILYYLVRKVKMFKFASESQKSESTIIVFFTSLLTPLLSYTSNLMIICSGGACSQIYLSTITSLLGAFGVTLTNISDYLFPITCVLMGISVFSLYIKRRKFKHKPFILGCFSAIMIIIGKYFDKSKLSYLCYPGNILMIIAAIWNAKLNKFKGLPC